MRISGESLKNIGETLRDKKSIEITRENVGEWRSKVGAWRETRVLDILATQIIPDLAEKALAANLPHDAASFWSELSLIGSQYIDAGTLY